MQGYAGGPHGPGDAAMEALHDHAYALRGKSRDEIARDPNFFHTINALADFVAATIGGGEYNPVVGVMHQIFSGYLRVFSDIAARTWPGDLSRASYQRLKEAGIWEFGAGYYASQAPGGAVTSPEQEKYRAGEQNIARMIAEAQAKWGGLNEEAQRKLGYEIISWMYHTFLSRAPEHMGIVEMWYQGSLNKGFNAVLNEIKDSAEGKLFRQSIGLYHTGGIVRGYGASDEVLAWLLRGEGVLNRQGVAAMGGEAGIERINQGQAATVQPSVIINLNTDFRGAFLADDMSQRRLLRKIYDETQRAVVNVRTKAPVLQ